MKRMTAYALAAIFKSTRTMDDLKTPATWHEPVVALATDYQITEAHNRRLAVAVQSTQPLQFLTHDDCGKKQTWCRHQDQDIDSQSDDRSV